MFEREFSSRNNIQVCVLRVAVWVMFERYEGEIQVLFL